MKKVFLACPTTPFSRVLAGAHKRKNGISGRASVQALRILKKKMQALSKVVLAPDRHGGLMAPSPIGGEQLMTTDAELKADLMERLDAIPAVKASEIEVIVDNGMVTLSGQVDTHQTRFQVERAARRVPGIRALAINVKHGQPASKKHHHEMR